MKVAETSITPIIKERTVALDVESAFELFTRRINSWWPLADHSVGGEEATAVVFEERKGGRLIERTRGEGRHVWAEVLDWDPPHRFILSWHPGRPSDTASVLEVRFDASGEGTKVTLEHRGWEELGLEEGSRLRDRYDGGWDGVLDLFARASRTSS